MKEGWGLATDGKVLFGSDGSSTLYQFEPQPFKGLSVQWSSTLFLSLFMCKPLSQIICVHFSNLKILCLVYLCLSCIFMEFTLPYWLYVVVSKQVVYYKGHQVHNLNELEYINGEVWANVLPVCFCVMNYDLS